MRETEAPRRTEDRPLRRDRMQEGKTLKWKITIRSRRRLEVVMGSNELGKPSSEILAFDADD